MSDQYSLDDHDGIIRLRQAWDYVARSLESELQKSTFDKFIAPLAVRDYRDGRAILTVPGQFAAEWVKSRFLARLEKMLGDEMGENLGVELRVIGRSKEAADIPDVALVQASVASDAGAFKPNCRYRFETFVVGQCNRMALAGARAVTAEMGQRYNPLFIYGSSGLGKTHLLHAIANQLLDDNPRLALRYITAQQFVEQFVQAFQVNRVDQFRKSQRNVDIWLVDDIQFVAGKDKTQEEVFHTFNHLYDLDRQIVLCSDQPPRNLHTMDERLRSRFECGLVVDIQPPDTETRAAILLSKAEQDRVHLDPSVALYLAEHVHGNIRHLVGALTKVAMMASMTQSVIDLSMAQSCVEKYYRRESQEKPGVKRIVGTVGKFYKISPEDIVGDSRKAPIAHARHVSIYIARVITGDSWKHLGSLFGNRDHTSMMHAYQKVQELIHRDKDLDSAIKSMIRELQPDQ